MAIRHHLKLIHKDTNKILLDEQVFGNNFFMENADYEVLNVKLDEDSNCKETSIDLETFINVFKNCYIKHFSTFTFEDFQKEFCSPMGTIYNYPSWTYSYQLADILNKIINVKFNNGIKNISAFLTIV